MEPPSLRSRLDRWRRRAHAGAVAAQLLVIGAVSYYSGPEISVSFLFGAPVAWAAWFLGREAGIIASAAAVTVWYGGSVLLDERYSSNAIVYWNTIIRFAYFGSLALIVAYLRVTHAALHRALRREQALARNDPLTGLLNVRAFTEVLERELARLVRYKHPLVLAFADVDGFKAINDSLGHSGGDALLTTIATRITKRVRSTDVVARLGGDEFGILLIETGPGAATVVLDDLRRLVAKVGEGYGGGISLSIGAVAVGPDYRGDPRSLITQADELMYEVKKSGKNAVMTSAAKADGRPVAALSAASAPFRAR